MKNIYSRAYWFTKIGLIIETLLFVLGVLCDFYPITIIILGCFAIISAIAHGSICERYEIRKRVIENIQRAKAVCEFYEELSKKLDEEKTNEEKS